MMMSSSTLYNNVKTSSQHPDRISTHHVQIMSGCSFLSWCSQAALMHHAMCSLWRVGQDTILEVAGIDAVDDQGTARLLPVEVTACTRMPRTSAHAPSSA